MAQLCKTLSSFTHSLYGMPHLKMLLVKDITHLIAAEDSCIIELSIYIGHILGGSGCHRNKFLLSSFTHSLYGMPHLKMLLVKDIYICGNLPFCLGCGYSMQGKLLPNKEKKIIKKNLKHFVCSQILSLLGFKHFLNINMNTCTSISMVWVQIPVEGRTKI
jgi:hypothetical protein